MPRLKCLKIRTLKITVKSLEGKVNPCFLSSLFVSLAYEFNMEDYSFKFRRTDKRGLETI